MINSKAGGHYANVFCGLTRNGVCMQLCEFVCERRKGDRDKIEQRERERERVFNEFNSNLLYSKMFD